MIPCVTRKAHPETMAEIEHVIAEEWTVTLRVPPRASPRNVERLRLEVGAALATLCQGLSSSAMGLELRPHGQEPP